MKQITRTVVSNGRGNYISVQMKAIKELLLNSVMIKRFRNPNEDIYSAKLFAAAIILTLIVALIRLIFG